MSDALGCPVPGRRIAWRPSNGCVARTYTSASRGVTQIRLGWDERNDASNEQGQYGLSFDEASTAFADENGILVPDPQHSNAEDRFVLLWPSKADKRERGDYLTRDSP